MYKYAREDGAIRMTKPEKRLLTYRFTLALLGPVLLGSLMLNGCATSENIQILNEEGITADSVQEPIEVGQIVASPLAEMLPELDKEDREHLEGFAATVPDPLPNELAYPQFTFMQADLSKADGSHILRLLDGYVRLQGVIANPGSNHEQTNVICLRNHFQVSCSSEADVWAVTLEPRTLAFVSYTIEAKPGDMLTFLYIANQEPLRLFPASIMQWLFVETEPQMPETFVQTLAHERVEVGCDFSTVAESDNLKFGMPGKQRRGTLLSLVFQPCEPVNEELVQLIPIVDRNRVVDLPDEVWNVPVRLSGPTTVIPIDTSLLGNAQEFQVAVVPVGKTAISLPEWWGWFPFTQAVHLVE